WLALERRARGPFNVGCGTATTVNRLAALVQEAGGRTTAVERQPPRAGEVRHSVAAIGAAATAFGYAPTVGLEAGLVDYMRWLPTA
ncbi:MAG TPA: hypothetical protein VJV75_02515, partial [Candidatus Polarisedimenticolia bacterium]|nr:hypothetical protein [Candidatus Polarisedimenticolia bacterium]